MPVYDYKCQEHGLFYGLATLDEHAEPRPCPDCGAAAPRVIVLAPALFGVEWADKKARERNEQACHEPRFSSPDSRAGERERQRHNHAHDHKGGAGCGCDERPIGKAQLFFTADGKKMFPAMRPWMISH